MATVKFGYDAENVADDCTKTSIETLKKWALDENLPELTNEQVLQFLVRTEHDVDQAKSAIKTCYHLKAKAPSIFTRRKIEEDLKNSLEQVIEICTMPKRTKDGCAIIFVRLIDHNYKNLSVDDYFKALFMTIDSAIYQQPLPGVVAIFDLNGVSLMHVTKVKLNLLKTAVLYMQDGLPVQLKAVHCINSVSLIDIIMKMIKPFVNSEFLENVKFHPRNLDMEQFYSNHIEKELLPEDMGGELPSVKALHQKHMENLSDLEEHFCAEEQQRGAC